MPVPPVTVYAGVPPEISNSTMYLVPVVLHVSVLLEVAIAVFCVIAALPPAEPVQLLLSETEIKLYVPAVLAVNVEEADAELTGG